MLKVTLNDKTRLYLILKVSNGISINLNSFFIDNSHFSSFNQKCIFWLLLSLKSICFKSYMNLIFLKFFCFTGFYQIL